MSRPASRITPEREALLRFFARGRNMQPAVRKHFDIYSALATARIGNAISACELRRVLPTRPGAPMTPAVYEITDKGRAALDAIDNPAEQPKPIPAKKLPNGSSQTPREMAVGLQAERDAEKMAEAFSYELLHKLKLAVPKGIAPHQPGSMLRSAPKPRPFPIAAGRDPCPRCGTRGDLGCKHRAPTEILPTDSFEPPIDGRVQSAGRLGHHLRKPSAMGPYHG